MTYPVPGTKGNVTCATASTYLNTLFGTSNSTGTLRVQTIGFNFEGPEKDITGFLSGGVTSAANIGGLRNATAEITGLYPKTITAGPAATTPRLGNSSLLTLAGYANLVDEFNLDIDWGEDKITSGDGTTIGWERYMPSGIVRWRGSFTARHLNNAVPALPTAVNVGGIAATFKLTEDGGSDPSFTGNVIVPRSGFEVAARGGQMRVRYDFIGDGDLTGTAGSTLPAMLAAAAIVPPDWDKDGDGTPDVQCVFTTYTSMTYTAYAYPKALSISAKVGEPLTAKVTLRISDAIT